MILAPDHARLMAIALPLCDRLGLALAGGYAVQAHGSPARPSKHLELATATAVPLPDVAAALEAAFQEAGCEVARLPGDPRGQQLEARLPGGIRARTVGLLKEPLGHEPVRLDVGLPGPVPVVALPDVAGMKVAALGDRALPRDLIDVHAMAGRFSQAELLSYCRLYADDEFSLERFADRLDRSATYMDEAFAAYGVTADRTATMRRWAYDWAQSLRLDLMEGMENPDALYEQDEPDVSDDL